MSHPSLYIFALSLLSAAACQKPPVQDPVPAPAGLSVTLTGTDGVRTLERVLRLPELALTVTGGREASVYEARLSVNGGRERTLRSIWNDVPKDLSGELLSFREYGEITVRGYLCDPSSPTVRIGIDTTLWMAYVPAETGPLTLVLGETDGPLPDKALLTAGQSGTLELRYTPEDTFLHVELSVPEGSPLLLGEPRSASGQFAVPFTVSGPGETALTLTTRNGRDTLTRSFAILCNEPELQQQAPIL